MILFSFGSVFFLRRLYMKIRITWKKLCKNKVLVENFGKMTLIFFFGFYMDIFFYKRTGIASARLFSETKKKKIVKIAKFNLTLIYN